jgi:CTP-dependent riboflavin kinase
VVREPDGVRVPLIFVGTVVAGYGAATRDVQAGIYPTPFVPYPGTLNLHVSPDTVDRFGPPAHAVTFAGIVRRLWPATVGNVPVMVMHPTGPGTNSANVELLAPCRLRDRYGLEDGDVLDVELEN